jgi:anti-sigma regulatory factor (Ser/Thr protein kinase)
MKLPGPLLSVPVMAPTGIADRSGGTAVRERLAGGATAPATARELVAGLLNGSMPEEATHDVLLLVTELVTNAVRHAPVDESAELELAVVATPARVRVVVTDPGGDDTPRMQALDPEVPGGMGLFLVDQISDRWGVERRDSGANRVWFELAR